MRARHLIRYICVLAVFFATFASTPPTVSWAQDNKDYGLGLARVSHVEGDTSFSGPGSDDWAALSPNFTLQDGDRLWAGENSKLEVLFDGGGKAWLNYQSELDITKLRRDREGVVYQLALVSGEGSFYVKDFKDPDSVFQVDASNVSVMAYGKAYFRMSALTDGTTQIGVRNGSVEVESSDGSRDTLGKGEMLEVSPAGRPSQVMPLAAKDAWDGWVSSRINFYKRASGSSRYLPQDIRDYSYEFDQGGRWVDYPAYGWVWVPVVVAGWTPYSNGRWVFIGDDFVWLPYDPWYAPFHYGRWTFVVSVGWCWVPPLPGVAIWSPGYVGWAWGPDAVLWVPLAPGEVYYGWGNYGPHTVNVYQTGVVNVTNVYVNSRVTNAVVAVNRNNFVMGKTTRLTVQRSSNPFITKGALGARVMGAPPIKELRPVRETRVPRPDVRLSGKARPPRLLQEKRSFIKERGAARGGNSSAFRPSKGGPGVRPEKRFRETPAPMRREEPFQTQPSVKKRGGMEITPKTAPEAAPYTPAQPFGREKKRGGMEIIPKTAPEAVPYTPAQPFGREKKHGGMEIIPKTSPEAAPYTPAQPFGREKKRGGMEITPQAAPQAAPQVAPQVVPYTPEAPPGLEKQKGKEKQKKEDQ